MMKHIFRQKKPDRPVFVLLHGTGGNEKDLIPLVELIDNDASYLGVLGEVRENGMPRFFRRLSEGVFDEEDLTFRTHQLHDFIIESAKEYDFRLDKIVLLGYSNGANIAQSLLLHHPKHYRYAMLHHPMNVKKDMPFEPLDHVHVFIGAGAFDPLFPIEETYLLQKRLTNAKANVHLHMEQAGHELTRNEVLAAIKWYESLSI